ncbi:MAG: hypothetical protein GXP17_04880 [Gammaproteobacteria bacterium]|nr:hypothetical protein [Gammaproteobacteria bacterium]
MSSKKSVSPLTFTPEPSRVLMLILLVSHLGGAALLWPLDLSAAVKALLVALLLMSLIASWPRRGKGGLQRLTWQADGDWLLQAHGGDDIEATLLPGSYRHPWLVVLNFQLEGSRRRRSVVLFADALEPEMHRKLRVRLGLGCLEK